VTCDLEFADQRRSAGGWDCVKVFVSYSHKQGEWVHHSLVPVLRASGVEVHVDRERFKAGFAVVGQMDAMQDQADRHVLVLSRDYLASNYCRHEMDRAIQVDPDQGKVIPTRLDDSELPRKIKNSNPLHVDLRNGEAADQWQLLIGQCGGELHMEAPAWIAALDKTERHLERNECVNVVVQKEHVAWRAWLDELRATRFPKLAEVDLENPLAIPRHGLIRAC
jgi:hypothetical protein